MSLEQAEAETFQHDYNLALLESTKKLLQSSYGDQKRTAVGFLCYVPIFIILVVYIYLQSDASNSQLLINAIQSAVNLPIPRNISPVLTTFQTINTQKDVYLWMNSVLMSMFYPLKSVPGESVPGFVRQYNMLLGGVRIRTQRVNASTCTMSDGLTASSPVYSMPCWSNLSSGQQTSPYGGDSLDKYTFTTAAQNGAVALGISAAIQISISAINYTGEGYCVYLGNDAVSARNLVASLKTNNFIDDATRFLAIEANMYNPSLNMFISVSIAFENGVGGGYIGQVSVLPFSLYKFDKNQAGQVTLVVLQWICIVYILFLAFMELREMFFCYRSGSWSMSTMFKEDRRFYLRPLFYFYKFIEDAWSVLDIVFIALGLAAISMTIYFYTSDEVRSYDLASAKTKFINLQPIAYYCLFIQYILAFMVLLAFFRMLRFMRIGLGFRTIWLTINRTMSYIIGFMVILIIVMFSFSFLFYIVYGTNVPQMATPIQCFYNISVGVFMAWDGTGVATSEIDAGLVSPFVFYIYSMVVTLILSCLYFAIICEGFFESSTALRLFDEDCLICSHGIQTNVFMLVFRDVVNAVKRVTRGSAGVGGSEIAADLPPDEVDDD